MPSIFTLEGVELEPVAALGAPPYGTTTVMGSSAVLEPIEVFGQEAFVCAPNLGDFGATDEELAAVGKALGEKYKASFWDQVPLTAVEDLAAALKPYYANTTDYGKVTAAYTTAGGDLTTLRKAQEQLAEEKRWDSWSFKPTASWYIWGALSTISGAACAYHGYKRNNSVGWAVGWWLLGQLFFPLTPVIALAQGFGKPRVPKAQ